MPVLSNIYKESVIQYGPQWIHFTKLFKCGKSQGHEPVLSVSKPLGSDRSWYSDRTHISLMNGLPIPEQAAQDIP